MKRGKILLTGVAGFIGFHVCAQLLKLGHIVYAIDNINDYYDINLKFARLEILGLKKLKTKIYSKEVNSIKYKNLTFKRVDISNNDAVEILFQNEKFDVVCHLAAQAGVRYSIKNPKTYINSNINGFLNILEGCRNNNIKRLVYASSSSVYGNSDSVPFKETANVDYPISLYAATKKSNELMAYTYSHLFGIETIGLRFFTVYGPWSRPDMAMYLFTDAILNKRPIKIFNEGNLSRDFTYITDIVDGVLNTLLKNSKNKALYKLYNIGNSRPIKLLEFVKAIEKELGITADKDMLPMQAGDVNKTWADISLIQKDYNYKSHTSIVDGVKAFVDWYKSYYNIKL